MTIPYPIDPSLPSNPAPLFGDSTAARGDHLRANNAEIWANFTNIVETILGDASLSTDGTFAALSDLLFPSQKAVDTYLRSVINSIFPVGSSIDFSGTVIPTGWMQEDGSSLLRASYPALYSALTASSGAVIISSANPGVVTLVNHPYQTGDCVSFTTTGALPTAITPSTNYYVVYVNTSTFSLATTYANAIAGTKINTTDGTQSGVHTLTWNPWGIADATHFYLPDMGGLSSEGSSQLTTNGAAWGGVNYIGRLGQYKQDRSQGHYHSLYYDNFSCIGGGASMYLSDTASPNQDTAGNHVRGPISDGTNGIPRTGITTYGPRVGKYKIIKVI